MELWQTIITTIGSVVVAMVTVGVPLLYQNKRNHRFGSEAMLEAIKDLKRDMVANNQLTVSNARAQLEAIYHKYERSKTMPESSWRAVCELHEAYKAITLSNGKHPNSWADALYREMGEWEKK